MRKGLQYNSSGYYDGTAFQAIKNVLAKDKQSNLCGRNKKIIKTDEQKSNLKNDNKR